MLGGKHHDNGLDSKVVNGLARHQCTDSLKGTHGIPPTGNSDIHVLGTAINCVKGATWMPLVRLRGSGQLPPLVFDTAETICYASSTGMTPRSQGATNRPYAWLEHSS